MAIDQEEGMPVETQSLFAIGDPGAPRAEAPERSSRARHAARALHARRPVREPPALQDRGAGPDRGHDGRRTDPSSTSRPPSNGRPPRLCSPEEPSVTVTRDEERRGRLRRDALDALPRLRLGRLTERAAPRIPWHPMAELRTSSAYSPTGDQPARDRAALRRAARGRALPDAARRDRHRQDGDDGLDHREGPAGRRS